MVLQLILAGASRVVLAHSLIKRELCRQAARTLKGAAENSN